MPSKRDIEAGQAFVRLFLKDDINAALSRAMSTAVKTLKSTGEAMMAAGSKSLMAGVSLAAPLAGSIAAGARFEDVLLDIQASTGATAAELDRLKAAAMSAKVGPASATESFLELLKAGMDLEKVLGGAGQAAIAFGRVGRMSAGESAVVMADAMKVFGVSADMAANTLSAAADASSTDIAGISEAFKQTSAVAALANQSIDATAAALAVMANAGVKGSDAGTSLKTMLLRLMAPTEQSAAAMESIGLSTDKLRGADGKMLPLVEIIQKLKQATAGLDTAARDAVFYKIFGSDAIRGAAILTQAGVEGYAAMKDGMATALPVGEKFAIMMSGLTGVKERLLAATERLAVTVSEILAPAIETVGGVVTGAIDTLTNFVKENRVTVMVIAGVATALVAGGAALIGLGVAAKVAAVALAPMAMILQAVGVVGNTIAMPFRLLGAAAVAASKAVSIAMRQAVSVTAGVFSGLAAGARGAFMPIVSAAASAGAVIGQRIGAGVGAAAVKTARFAAQSVPAVIKSLQGIGPAAREAWSMIKTTADPAYLKATWQDIRSAAGRAFRAMRSDAFSFYKLLRTSLDPAYLKATWASVRTGAAVAFRSARASVFGFYNALRNARGMAAGMVGTMAKIGGSMGRGLGRLGGAAGGLVGAAGMLGAMGIGGAFAPMLAMAPLVLSVLGSIGSAVAAVASPVGLLAAGIVAGAVAWVKYSEAGQAAWQSILAVVLPIVETLKGTFAAVKDAIVAGDWGTAGKLAIAGLKLAVFQGLGEIEKAFPNVFATILRTVGKIGNGLITAWGKVTGFLTDQWNNWGQSTLNTVLEVAGMIPEIWETAVQNMANWMLEQSAKGGLSGAIMSKILGVDMADEQARAEAMEEARRQVHRRNLEHSIAQGKKEGLDTTQLENDLASLGGPQQKVDVLADARQAVKAYTDQLRSDLSGAGGTPGDGAVSQALESFLTKIESGVSVADAQAEFEALKAELAAAKQAEATGPAAGTPAAAGQAGPQAAPAVAPAVAAALAPRGIALGPTYSAAAAQAAGQMGRGSPQEKMVSSINQMAKDLRELGLIARNQDVSNKQVVTMYERFLSAFQYG